MTTATSPAPHRDPREARRPTWWVVVLVAAIAACIGVGAGYLLFASTQADETRVGRADVTPEEIDRVTTLLDDYLAAWNAYDAEAIRASHSDGFVFKGYTPEGTDRLLDTMIEDFATTNEQAEHLGDRLIAKDYLSGGGGYDVAVLTKLTWFDPEEQTDYAVNVLRLVDEDGALKIHRSYPSEMCFQ